MLIRKVEERNEKIIRGLLKLPPNRRCINCNSLGPQYVCTNFWTFVCTTCSGIHREFTHRVKSISMSKFTTQEVEALQNGGNQRARELHLKGWDFQRQRFPDSSNTDKVREFIKNVYVDKKYNTGKISDAQSPDSHDEHRRASSYHSYSQSPPYEHQYEERKYGKRDPVLTRKPGSDRTLYEGKFSSFVYSPTRMSEQACDEKYTNEGSVSRLSLHSESSGGDPFRSEIISPSSLSNNGLGSPYSQGLKEWPQTTKSYNGDNAKRDQNRVPRPQRTVSSGSFGSFDGNSMSSDSYNPNSQVRVVSEQDQTAHQCDKLAVSSLQQQPSISSLNIFDDPVAPHSGKTATVDLFQLPTVSATQVSSFQASTLTTALSANVYQSSTNPAPFLDLFGDGSQSAHVSTSEQVFSQLAVPKNDGWATFDTQPSSSSQSLSYTNVPTSADSTGVVNLFPRLSADDNAQQKSLQSESVKQNQAPKVAADEPYSSIPSPWSEVMHQYQAISGTGTSQSWNAFGDSAVNTQWYSGQQKVEPQFVASVSSPSINLYMGLDQKTVTNTSSMSDNGPPLSTVYPQQPLALIPGLQSFETDQKYTNPFDIPFDMDSHPDNSFIDMNSMEASLPSNTLQSTFGELSEPWLFHHPVTTYPTFAKEASTTYIAGQSPASNFQNIPPHGPLTSIGGNPFA